MQNRQQADSTQRHRLQTFPLLGICLLFTAMFLSALAPQQPHQAATALIISKGTSECLAPTNATSSIDSTSITSIETPASCIPCSSLTATTGSTGTASAGGTATTGLCPCPATSVPATGVALPQITHGDPDHHPHIHATATPNINATVVAAVIATIQANATATATAATATVTAGNGAVCSGQLTAWPDFDGGPSRSGFNAAETQITPDTVSQLSMRLQTKLPAVADSTPVALSQVQTANGMKDLLYVTTTNGSLLAIDAQTGKVVWQQGGVTPDPQGVKITTSSPAIDPSGQFVYSYGQDGKVHKYDSGTGKQITTDGWPVTVTLMPATEKVSSALNITNGFLYVTTSGYPGDGLPYVGHIVAINLDGTAKPLVFNALCANITTLLNQTGTNPCPDEQAGIWARAGVVVDDPPPAGTGHIFVATGNGPYNTSKFDYGDSVLALTPDLNLVDVYAPPPAEQMAMQQQDEDLGSSAPALLPRQDGSSTPLMLVQASKDRTLRLLNREDLAGRQGPALVQEIQHAQNCDVDTQPAVWTDQNGTTWVFIATDCGFSAYTVHTDSNTKKSSLVLAYHNAITGTSPIVAGGLVFVQGSKILHALDPKTGNEVWNSTKSTAKGTIGTRHWQSPIVMNGQIYAVDSNGQFTAYALPA